MKKTNSINRRKFLSQSAVIAAGLWVSNSLVGCLSNNSCSAGKKCKCSMPDTVKIIPESGAEKIAVRKGDTFCAGSAEVQVCETADGLKFWLSSPKEKIKKVIACWNTPRNTSSKYLGDHWERGYGDLEWKKADFSRIMPWYFLEFDGKATNGVGVMTGCNTFCSWRVSPERTELAMDTRNGSHGVELGNRKLDMATVVLYKGAAGQSPFESGRSFCKIMCPNPRLPKEPVYGINDWYFAYGKSSDKLILQIADLVKDLMPKTKNRPFFVIDAGWACFAPWRKDAGGWSDNFIDTNENFKDMKALADSLRARGMRPGLWMRPLCAPYGAKEDILLPKVRPDEDPRKRVLDPTVKRNIDYIKKCYQTYRKWGYEMVKQDFTTYDIFGKWGFEMLASDDITQGDWTFHDRTLTNAEVVLNLYRSIRSSAGPMYVIACDTISHLSAGIFEIMRTGDDTSGLEWSRTLKMGVNTLAFRAHQHNAFYSCDPDCVGLTTKIKWDLNKQWMQLVSESGMPLFVSPQPQAVGPKQRECMAKCFALASQELPLGEPLDWFETKTPTKWKLNGKIRQFNWQS